MPTIYSWMHSILQSDVTSERVYYTHINKLVKSQMKRIVVLRLRQYWNLDFESAHKQTVLFSYYFNGFRKKKFTQLKYSYTTTYGWYADLYRIYEWRI